jgi:hypothetical protein
MIRDVVPGCIVALLLITSGVITRSDPAPFGRVVGPERPTVLNASQSYGRLPLSFEANQGQSEHPSSFLSRGTDYTLFLSGSDALLELRNAQSRSSVVRMNLVGSNPKSAGIGMDTLPGRVNYLVGNDSSKWRTDIPTYAKVRYEEVYPGVDVVYYGNHRQLEYDFIVAPGADPDRIKLDFEGPDDVTVDAAGDLLLSTAGGPVRMHKPFVYQEIDGTRVPIEGAFKTFGPRLEAQTAAVGFELGEYDVTRPLVIDPVLSYSTYFGGAGVDQGRGIAVDASGSVYITGNTNSSDLFKASSAQRAFGGGTCGDAPCSDAFVAKLNPAGTALVYTTYIGGSSADQGNGIVIDPAGNAYIVGQTTSSNFPTVNPIQATFGGGTCGTGPAAGPCTDTFVAKLNPAGSQLVYSTYLGGSGLDNGNGLTVDSSGSVHIVGQTSSTNFPTAKPFQAANAGGADDVFIAKLNPAGSALVYSTYLGGTLHDVARVIAVDASGNSYFTGLSNSTDYPTTKDAFLPKLPANNVGHGFVSKLDAAGMLVSSTWLGGNDVDDGFGVVLDGRGNLYVTGDTRAKDFPTKSPIQAANAGGTFDNFVVKMKTEGLELLYSTYLGGDLTDQPKGIGLDAAGNIYVVGNTNSTNFPTRNPLQASPGGGTCGTAAQPAPCNDFFITKLSADGSSITYSTYLGGTGLDAPNNGNAVAVDAAGNVYVVGHSVSPNFPTKNPMQAASGGSNDVVIFKITP